MRNVRFESSPAEQMTHLVALKRIEGYDYSDQASKLCYFDRFLCQQDWSRQWLTADLFQMYIQYTEPLAAHTRVGRLSVVRVFSRFVHSFHPSSAVLHHIPVKRPSLPRFYLYSREEITGLLSAALQLAPTGSLRPHRFHMLIGLIRATGLRISEALGLELRDLEPEHGRLLVRNGKFGKQRYVPIHCSTVVRLQAYLDIRQRYSSDAPSAPLFPGRAGRRLSYCQTNTTFHRLCDQASIGLAAAKPPRLHDLRHTYACNCLEKWRREGADVNAKLPLLATAMGHTKIESTQIYLHVTPQHLREASERLRNHLVIKAKGN